MTEYASENIALNGRLTHKLQNQLLSHYFTKCHDNLYSVDFVNKVLITVRIKNANYTTYF